MEKRQIVTLAYWIMIVFVIATCIFFYFYLSGSTHQCLTDPLKFYQDKVGTTCFCVDQVPIK